MKEVYLYKIFPNQEVKFNQDLVKFNTTGKTDSTVPNTVTFVDSKSYLNDLLENKNIEYVFLNNELAKELSGISNLKLIISEQPKLDFYKFHNYYTENFIDFEESYIDETAIIGKNTFIESEGVKIGKNTEIGHNSVILKGVEIGENCIIGPNCVIGNDSFEYHKHNGNVLKVKHDGKVIIKNNVELGSSVTVDKGLMSKNTVLEDNVKIDNQSHLSHNVIVDSSTLMAAGVIVAGNVYIGKNVWVGPRAVISNRLIIENNSRISIGAVVVNNIKEGETVSGNFAIDHRDFMKFYTRLKVRKNKK